MNKEQRTAKPFVKWVGGKTQLLSQLEKLLPQEIYDEEFTYIEPFVGGGAMLFFMLQKFPNIKKAVINDLNCNLIDTYINIKKNPEKLIEILKKMEKYYLSITKEVDRRTFYLDIRRQFNENQLSNIEKSAFFIFLNRTCFNGLYRENSKGKFNVPFGRYANPTICNEELIYSDCELLNKFNVVILNADYSETYKEIDNDRLNFFYFDPPYRPLSSTSSFNNYVKENFGDNEQNRLADFCHTIDLKDNCIWMLNNSDCSSKNPQDTFFEELYRDFNIYKVYAKRNVNANANKRGTLTELLINNF